MGGALQFGNTVEMEFDGEHIHIYSGTTIIDSKQTVPLFNIGARFTAFLTSQIAFITSYLL